jgi:tetratricopeptide (TPR) repeat protein
MSRKGKPDYGTHDPRAFAHFVAGTFAERRGWIESALTLYSQASALDPYYDKALNNRGLLILQSATEAYIKGTAANDAAQRLLVDAEGLFRKALTIDGRIPEYFYNLGNTLSYRGRLAERLGDAAAATPFQRSSIDAYGQRSNLSRTN